MSRPRRSGNTVVELAFTLPVLLALLVGVADYGWYFLQRAAVLDAARDAVRIGVASPENQDPVALALEHAQAILDAAGHDLGDTDTEARVVDLDGTWALTVRTSRPYEPLAGLVPVPEQVSAAVTMMLEHQDLGYYGL